MKPQGSPEEINISMRLKHLFALRENDAQETMLQEAIWWFTTTRKTSIEIGRDFGIFDKDIPIIISTTPPNSKVMVSMRDMMNLGFIQKYELADWHHQNEVVVLVDEPLPLKSVEFL